MKISSIKNLKKMQEKHGFFIKKRYGQNFLIDENILNKIVNLADVKETDAVIEIGPGMGALTQKLAEKAKKVFAYEIDEKLEPLLTETLAAYKNVNVIYSDFLMSDVKKDINFDEYERILVVANLPYYITTPIITKIIEDKLDIFSITVMLQKEVANRFLAIPKTKEYSSLSIFINYFFEFSGKFKVSKNVFIPKPSVDSIVISLKKRTKKIHKVKNEDLFFKIVRAAFKFKRKNLKNNFTDYNYQEIEKVLIEEGYKLTNRAEELPIEVFVKIVERVEF